MADNQGDRTPDARVRRRGMLRGSLGSLALAGLASSAARAADMSAVMKPLDACVGVDDQPAAITIRPGIKMAYADDYFGAPWIKPEVIVLMHGNGESGKSWTQWVGPLSAQFRVIRPDMPGFGRSPVPAKYDYSPKGIAADIGLLMTKLGVTRFHLVGAKYGGTVCLQLAADEPDRIMSLAVYGTPVKGANTGGKADMTAFPNMIKKIGVRAFSEQTQRARLGSEASQAQLDWWSDSLMGPADPRSLIAATSATAVANVEDRLSSITAPTLVVTTAESALQPVAAARAYQERIPHSKLMVLPGDSYHVAAVHPQECAVVELDFIKSLSKPASATKPG